MKEEPIDLVDSDSDEEGGQNRGAGYPHFTPLGADTRKSSKGDSAPLPVPGGPKGREGDAPRAPLLTVNPNVSWPEQRLHKVPQACLLLRGLHVSEMGGHPQATGALGR